MSGTDGTVTMFERIGGAAAVDRLVEAFYRRMDHEPAAALIRTMHPEDLGPTKQVLKRYLTEWAGGPKLYSPEKGHPRLRQRHMPFRIGDAERDAWLVCMRAALAEVVANAEARSELDLALTRLADWMRNHVAEVHGAPA